MHVEVAGPRKQGSVPSSLKWGFQRLSWIVCLSGGHLQPLSHLAVHVINYRSDERGYHQIVHTHF